MATPEKSLDSDLDAQDLTDDNLEEVNGGVGSEVAAQGAGNLGNIPLVGDGASALELVRRNLL
jgi:hypothetical protein